MGKRSHGNLLTNPRFKGPSEQNTEEVGSIVQFAAGSADSPGVKSQMSFAMRRGLSSAKQNVERGSAAAAGRESPWSDSEPGLEGLQPEYSELYSNAVPGSSCRGSQTPNLTAETAGTRRSREMMQAELDKLEAIIRQGANPDTDSDQYRN